MILTLLFVGCVLGNIEDGAFYRNPRWLLRVRSYRRDTVSVICYLLSMAPFDCARVRTIILRKLLQRYLIVLRSVKLNRDLGFEPLVL